MKSQEKRIKKLCEGMSKTARIRAVLDAIRVDDVSLRDGLLEATPRLSYTVLDIQVTDSIGAAHILSLRFDRTFYHLLACSMACQIPSVTTNRDPKEILVGIENMDNQLCALTSGVEIFAERIGLDLSQVLAFSMALDFEFDEIKQPLDTLSEDDLERANGVADAFQELWGKHGNAIENFGEAA